MEGEGSFKVVMPNSVKSGNNVSADSSIHTLIFVNCTMAKGKGSNNDSICGRICTCICCMIIIPLILILVGFLMLISKNTRVERINE